MVCVLVCRWLAAFLLFFSSSSFCSTAILLSLSILNVVFSFTDIYCDTNTYALYNRYTHRKKGKKTYRITHNCHSTYTRVNRISMYVCTLCSISDERDHSRWTDWHSVQWMKRDNSWIQQSLTSKNLNQRNEKYARIQHTHIYTHIRQNHMMQ